MGHIYDLHCRLDALDYIISMFFTEAGMMEVYILLFPLYNCLVCSAIFCCVNTFWSVLFLFLLLIFFMWTPGGPATTVCKLMEIHKEFVSNNARPDLKMLYSELKNIQKLLLLCGCGAEAATVRKLSLSCQSVLHLWAVLSYNQTQRANSKQTWMLRKKNDN